MILNDFVSVLTSTDYIIITFRYNNKLQSVTVNPYRLQYCSSNLLSCEIKSINCSQDFNYPVITLDTSKFTNKTLSELEKFKLLIG